MFPEDRLQDERPLYWDGYYSAERDHEDGATLRGIIERAESLIPDTPVSQRPYLIGRAHYARQTMRLRR
jgi:hypothetical protein